jgi:ABC-2 type transport system permease protein
LVASLGICALGVGLGACLPNFKETDPSKIAAGFGGTLNLVISLFLLIVLMGLLSGIWHLNHTGENYTNPSFTGTLFIIAGIASGSEIGLMAALIPMALGSQNLRSKEF